MKKVLIPILLLLLMVQTFSKWMQVIEYELNKTFIAEKLCENKKKPQLKCAGKCQLKKQLEESQKESKNNGATAKTQMAEVLFVNNSSGFYLELPVEITQSAYPVFITNCNAAPTPAIFHPPAIA